MIVLDTNVISEMMRPAPDPAVGRWLSAQAGSGLYTTAICEAELCYGIARLTDGRRKRGLAAAMAAFFEQDLGGRVLPFDRAAAAEFATIGAGLRAAGKSIDTADLQIAAITRVNGYSLATRNTRHFAACGIDLIDPFTPAAGR